MSDAWKMKLVEEVNDLKGQRRRLIQELSKAHVLFQVASARFAGYALSVNSADPRNDEILEPINEGIQLTEECYKHMPERKLCECSAPAIRTVTVVDENWYKCPRCGGYISRPCNCGAKPEHTGDGIYAKWHAQDCPKFDGDHPERCENPEEDGYHRLEDDMSTEMLARVTANRESDGLVEAIKRVIIDKELTPDVCEDSGEAEWCEGEARKLAEAIAEIVRK